MESETEITPHPVPMFSRDCRDLVAVLSRCLAQVIEKEMDPSQANAICNLVNTALRVFEVEHRMKGIANA